jgi:4-azaleucine resistance transporter AzlC
MNIQIAAQKQTRAQIAREFRRGLRSSLPITLGVAPAGLVLGAQAAQKGFSSVEVPLLTGLNFAGGSEFAAIGLWTSPPHILLIAAITFLVNSRHILMGAALAPLIKHLPRRITYPALFLMCDESWAMALTDGKQRAASGIRPGFSLAYYLAISAVFYFTWVICTTAGGVLGPVLGDLRVYGLDMAFPAIFLVLLRGMWKSSRDALPWLVSLVVAALTYRLVPGAWYVVAGAVSGLGSAYLLAGKS